MDLGRSLWGAAEALVAAVVGADEEEEDGYTSGSGSEVSAGAGAAAGGADADAPHSPVGPPPAGLGAELGPSRRRRSGAYLAASMSARSFGSAAPSGGGYGALLADDDDEEEEDAGARPDGGGGGGGGDASAAVGAVGAAFARLFGRRPSARGGGDGDGPADGGGDGGGGDGGHLAPPGVEATPDRRGGGGGTVPAAAAAEEQPPGPPPPPTLPGTPMEVPPPPPGSGGGGGGGGGAAAAGAVAPPPPPPPPALPEPSGLMTPDDAAALAASLPARWRLARWALAYSTARDGTSLATLYRMGRDAAPSVLLIRTAGGAVFGAFASAAWRPDAAPGRYYGDGTAFVFTLRAAPAAAAAAAAGGERAGAPPEVEESGDAPTPPPGKPTISRRLWRWHARYCTAVARNDFFQLARPSALALGGGAGSAGWALSLDAGLERGTSRPCTTFGTPAPLAEGGEFGVGRVELWGLR